MVERVNPPPEVKNKLSIVRIQNDDVKEAVNSALSLIDAEKMMKTGMKILIKPNVLMAKPPEKATTTHPSVLKAIIDWLQQFNPEKIFVADSSGGTKPGFTENAFKVSGLRDVCEQYSNVEWTPFEKTPIVSFKVPNPLVLKEINASSLFNEVDLIIDVPKMKTHTLTGVTLGIKNMFGTLILANKAKTHLDFPKHENFSAALADIYSVSSPQLTIVDGYWAQEGNGPSAGDPVKLDLIVAGYNGVAVDSLLCRIMGVDPHSIIHIKKAEQKGLGPIDFERAGYEVVGEKIEDVKRPFKRPKGGIKSIPLPSSLAQWISKNVFRPHIEFDLEKCTLCGTCWSNCPAHALSPPDVLDPKKYTPNWDPNKCIFCYCCSELCPSEAVEFEVNIKRNIMRSKVKYFLIGIFAALGGFIYLLVYLLS